MAKIITFGEIMLRLAPKGYLRFLQEPEFQATIGGGEANVAVALANMGMDVAFVTKLPLNDIGEGIVRNIRQYHVDTKYISRGGERTGVYYLEKGASQRPSQVIYDRKNSAFSTALENDFKWNDIFCGAEWFHFTGITPALSPQCTKLCKIAVEEAKKRNLFISCDLNYRKNLWSRSEAEAVMGELLRHVDLCIANEEDADQVFGIKAPKANVDKGMIDREEYHYVAKSISDRFGCERVAITLRKSISASDNLWSAMLYMKGGESIFSREYPIHIIDRVGGGDSFGAGLIYGLFTGMCEPDALEFAVAASCLKHTIEGDFNLVTIDEIMHLVKGDASGRVKR